MSEEELIIKKEIVKSDTDEKTVYHYINSEKDYDIKTREVFKREDKTILFFLRRDYRSGEIVDKYEFLKTITLIGFSGKIPSGFSSKASIGYRPTPTLAPFIKYISKNSTITNINILKSGKTTLIGNKLSILHSDIETIRKKISSLNRSNNEKIKDLIQNYLYSKFPTRFQTIPKRYYKGTIHRIITEHKNIIKEMNVDDRKALLDVSDRLKPLRGELQQRKKLIQTKEIIEKKFIEDVEREFERLLSLQRISEETWQKFFKQNAWIFSQLFAHPTVLFDDQVYVGGKNIKDKEGKYVDFLYQNKLTKNSAIVEIKKHNTKLLSKKPYRGTKVFNLDKEFSGAISQILDQKATYCRKFDSIREEDDIHPFNPKCILVIGSVNSLSKSQQESFELVRSNLKDVEVVTFDELLEKIRGILSIFRNDEGDEIKEENSK